MLKGFSFSADAGSILCFTGPNGCGKSTLLRTIAGLHPLTAGEIVWNKTAICQDPPSWRAKLSYLGHRDGLKMQLTANENLAMAGKLAGSSYSPRQALERLGVLAWADADCAHLSAGLRRKIALARVLLSQATVWLLDEPFANLDDAGTQAAAALIQQHASDGGIVLTCAPEKPSYLNDVAELRLADA